MFVQTNTGSIDYGFKGVATCSGCVAANNLPVGNSLAINWADNPGAFEWSMSNFSTTDYATDNGSGLDSNELTLTSGTRHATLVASPTATQDTLFVLPRNSGAWGQQLTTDGAGILHWADRLGGHLKTGH